MENDAQTPLVTLALEGIARLDDDTREDALRTLGSVLAGISFDDELGQASFERLLALAAGLDAPWSRARAYADACASLACSRLPRALRAALLEDAYTLARTAENPVERVERSRCAAQALAEIQRDETIEARVKELADEALALEDPRPRQRMTCDVALTFAKIGEGALAVRTLDALPPSAIRARALVHVASEMIEQGDEEAGLVLLESTIGELQGEPESFEKALGVRDILVLVIEKELRLPTMPALATMLAFVDDFHDGRFKKDALIGAVQALYNATHEHEAFGEMVELVRACIDRVDETYTRAPILGELAVMLCTRRLTPWALRALEDAAAIGARAQVQDVTEALGDPVAALPVAKMLAALADDDPSVMHGMALRALDCVRAVDEPRALASIVRQCAQLFASPALPSEYRVDLLDKLLALAEAISSVDVRVEAAVAVANALSLAGATDRGDALFSGIVIGIDPGAARRAHLERAVTLVRLGRSPESRDQLVKASLTPTAHHDYAVVELASACARAGFIGDLLEVLKRIDGEQQEIVRMDLADLVANSSWNDPALRIVGLSALQQGAGPAVADGIAARIAEVNLIERIGGSPSEVVATARAQFDKMENRDAAATLEAEIVAAITERLRRDN